MSVPAEIMAMLQQAGGAPGGPGGRPPESGLPGMAPEGIQREPGDMDQVEEDPVDLIREMIDLARDFLDSDDVPEQGKQVMEKVTTLLTQLTASEEKAMQSEGAASLVARGQAA